MIHPSEPVLSAAAAAVLLTFAAASAAAMTPGADESPNDFGKNH